jgi:aspartate kinase
VVVDVVTTSEVSVSITANAAEPLERAAAELLPLVAGEGGAVRVERGRSIVVVVGQHLARRPGLGAEILGAIARVGVNVEMISHAFGSINLSVVVRDEDVAKTALVLHDVLFEK